MKMIIRADDFGFSEAVNYGILKAFQGGLVKNIGLMSNMPYAKQAFDMIRKCHVRTSCQSDSGKPLCQTGTDSLTFEYGWEVPILPRQKKRNGRGNR